MYAKCTQNQSKILAFPFVFNKIEWRRGWDLNPRYPLRYVRFRGGSFQPLTHLSGKQKSVASRLPGNAMQRDTRLTTAFKERLQQLGAAAGENSAAYLDLVVQLRMIQHLHRRTNGSRFRIVGAIDETADASMHHGAGAHGTRFNCNKQITAPQTVVAEVFTGLAQCDDFCVG